MLLTVAKLSSLGAAVPTVPNVNVPDPSVTSACPSDPSAVGKVYALLNVIAPELTPLIQATEPSTPSAIINCLSPVAESALMLPIITLPSPLVILSPA